MQLVDIQHTDQGFLLDPSRYLARLERSRDQLPRGAFAFASDPGHYTFGDRCLNSLHLDSMSLESHDGGIDARLVFRGPGAEGEPRLDIRYAGITEFSMTLDSESNTDRDGARPGNLKAALLDEILRAESGCSHEIRFIAGTVKVSYHDLHAEWCAER